MQTVFLLAVGAAVAVIVLRVFARDAAGNWLHWGRTKVGQAGDYATTLDPAGQMKQAARDAAAELTAANQALITADSQQAKLTEQIAHETQTKKRIEAEVRQLLKPAAEGGKGRTPNDPVVVEKLKRVADLEESIAANSDQLAAMAADYQETLKNAKAAGARIAAAQHEADRLKVQLDLGEQNAKVREMLAKYNPAAVDSKLAAMDKYREAAQDKLRGYASAQRVARDLNPDAGLDDGDVTPDTDERLAGVLARIQGKPTAAPPSGV